MELKDHFKIIMLGVRGVGKSSLITRFYSNSFNEEYSPTLDDVFSKPIILNNRKIRLGKIVYEIQKLSIQQYNGNMDTNRMSRLNWVMLS